VPASFRLAALLLATNFVASALAQSTGSRPQPNADQQTQLRPELIQADRWLRNSTSQSLLATRIEASSAAPLTKAADFQIGQKWADRRMGPTKQAPTLKGLVSDHQERSASGELRDNYGFSPAETGYRFDVTATSTAAVNRAEPANQVPTEMLLLEPSSVLASLCTPMTHCAAWFSIPGRLAQSEAPQSERPIEENDDKDGEASKPPVKIVRPSKPIDFNQSIYYRNKTEFGLDIGWLPVNIPFVFDIFLGDGYNNPPLYYTLVPIIASLRWQLDDVGGPWILRGNWDLQTSLGIVPIPRGPETHYFSWIMGLRRNFVPHRGKVAPYFDFRLGMGRIDAKEPLGVQFAQGQNFTFTMNMGSGVRYNFNQKYSISAGMNWMHISNAYLSEPQYPDYGINVYGPMFGIDVRLGKPRRNGSQ
jgi:hypothetical protein